MLLLLADSRSSHQSCFARSWMRSTPARWNWFPTGKKDFITRRNVLVMLGGRWGSWKRCSHENTIEIYYKKATIIKMTKFRNFINVLKTMTLRAIKNSLFFFNRKRPPIPSFSFYSWGWKSHISHLLVLIFFNSGRPLPELHYDREQSALTIGYACPIVHTQVW